MSQIGTFGTAGTITLNAVIPPGPNPTIDPNWPPKLPCSNPAECAVLGKMIAAIAGVPGASHAGWNCAVYHPVSGAVKLLANYGVEELNAYLNGVTGAQPPPGVKMPGCVPAPPPNVVPGKVFQFPGEEA